MNEILMSVIGVLIHHEWLGEVVLLGLTLLGFMHFSIWWLKHFVIWSHQIRLLWRRFKGEPIPDAVHN